MSHFTDAVPEAPLKYAVLIREYYELVVEFLTNDIQQGPPAVLAQHKRMDELEWLLGEDLAKSTWDAADEATLEHGFYASGAPYPF